MSVIKSLFKIGSGNINKLYFNKIPLVRSRLSTRSTLYIILKIINGDATEVDFYGTSAVTWKLEGQF